MAHLIVFDGERPAVPPNIPVKDTCPYGSSAYVVGGEITAKQVLEVFGACGGEGRRTALVVKIESYPGLFAVGVEKK